MAEFGGATGIYLQAQLDRFSPVQPQPSTAIRTVLQRGEDRRQERTACVSS